MPNTETLSFYDSNTTFNISNYNDLNSESSCLKETGIIEKMVLFFVPFLLWNYSFDLFIFCLYI